MPRARAALAAAGVSGSILHLLSAAGRQDSDRTQISPFPMRDATIPRRPTVRPLCQRISADGLLPTTLGEAFRVSLQSLSSSGFPLSSGGFPVAFNASAWQWV